MASQDHPQHEPGLTPGAHPDRRRPEGDGSGDEGGAHGGGGMGMRGVTRPMAEKQMRQHHEQMNDDGEENGDDDGGMSEPYSDGRYEMLRMHHRQTLWVYWTLVLLGLWQLVAPFTFGYLNEALWVDPSGGRGVWFSEDPRTELRAWLMTWSDVASGLLLLVFGWRSLKPDRPVSRWICCFVGIWLTLAPLVFWAPTAASYLNATFVGMLVIALAILIPGMPNMPVYMKMGGDLPPGWSYNPSSWPQRWIMIATGFVGFLASRYLGAFQLGYLDTIWDPFFGGGTRQVLNSDMSHMWPVSDAALGTFAYTFEFLMGWMGAPSRWRTMPWMVTFFGILVIPLGLIHIFLVISQPVVVGFWCTFCLLAAAIMLPMIPLEVDEVVAMGQHVKRSMDKGTSFWTAFWKGGPADEVGDDERSPALAKLPDEPGAVLKASVWGMSVPWTLAVSTALGIGIVFLPGLFGAEGTASDVLVVGGLLIVTVSVIAFGEVVRAGRFLNVLLGLGVAALPWVYGAPTIASVLATITGFAVAALAVPRGPKTETYGSWDRFVR